MLKRLIVLLEGQERLLSVLAQMERSDAQDAESRMRLRSIDVQLLRLLEEISTGRQETTIALRQQLERLTSAILMTWNKRTKAINMTVQQKDF